MRRFFQDHRVSKKKEVELKEAFQKLHCAGFIKQTKIYLSVHSTFPTVPASLKEPASPLPVQPHPSHPGEDRGHKACSSHKAHVCETPAESPFAGTGALGQGRDHCSQASPFLNRAEEFLGQSYWQGWQGLPVGSSEVKMTCHTLSLARETSFRGETKRKCVELRFPRARFYTRSTSKTL